MGTICTGKATQCKPNQRLARAQSKCSASHIKPEQCNYVQCDVHVGTHAIHNSALTYEAGQLTQRSQIILMHQRWGTRGNNPGKLSSGSHVPLGP
eukprot:4967091-Pyramimonas_sp.AAC.1